MKAWETESLFPDGETHRSIRLTLLDAAVIRVEVLEGPPLGDLQELVPVGAYNPEADISTWQEYIAHEWRFLQGTVGES